MRLVSTVTTVHPHTYKHTPKHLQIPTHAPIYIHTYIYSFIQTGRERECTTPGRYMKTVIPLCFRELERERCTKGIPGRYMKTVTVMFQRERESAPQIYLEGI